MSESLQHLDQLPGGDARRHFVPGEQIFAEGDPGDALYVLLEGDVEISHEGSHIDFLRSRTIFGEMALVDEGRRSATAVAVTPVTVLAIDRGGFRDILRSRPEFATEVMAIMTARLRRLTGQEVQRQRIEQELEIGRNIQRSLLPETDPQLPGWEVASYYQAARQVGGDMYDYILPPDDSADLVILIADVTGKGVPAAMFMAVARTMLHMETRRGHGPAAILQQVNETILTDSRTPLFLSALCARLANSEITFASAGHEAPLLRPAAGGPARFLPSEGLVLGAFPQARYEDRSLEMAPGDTVLLYTDGVTEARNGAGKFFGEERLLQAAADTPGHSPAQLIASVIAAVDTYRGDMPQADDLTLVAFRRRP